MSKQLQNEIVNIRLEAEKEALQAQRKLMLVYKKSMNNIQSEIGKIYAKQSIDGVLNISNKQRLAILKSLDSQLKTMYSELGKMDQQITLNMLMKSYESAYYKTLYTIDRGLSTAINFDLLNPKMIDKAVNVKFKGATFSDRIWKNKKLLIGRLKNNVNRAIIEGKSIDKLAKDIKNTFGSTAYESKRLLNTETARVVSEAQSDIYANSEMVHKVRWDATLDSSTSEICEGYADKEWDANENHPIPVDDSHPNCRCCLIPVIDGWSPSKKIDNETKEVIEYSSYSDWKSNKGIE